MYSEHTTKVDVVMQEPLSLGRKNTNLKGRCKNGLYVKTGRRKW
jgi:hypothetical protein